MAARKKAPEPEPVDEPRDAADTPDDAAIEADIIQETPTPYDRRIEQVSTRKESYIVPAPINGDSEPAAATPAQTMAEELREDISPVDELLDDLGPENGAAVYIYRMPDLMRKRFRNPCNEKTFMGQITVDREHKTRALIEIETQRQFGGGYYLFDLRYGERNSIKGKWMQTIADPPWSNADAAPSAQGSTVPSAPSVASKSLNQELRELRETSELLGWGPVRPQASQQADPLQTVQQTVGMISGVAEAIKILQPDAPLAAGAGWKDMVVQLGPMIMPELKGMLNAAISRLSAPAMPRPQFFAPPNGGIPLGQVHSQIPPTLSPEQIAEAQFHEREAAKNRLMGDFIREAVAGIVNNEFPEVAAKIAIQGAREFPEMMGEVIVQASATPEMTLQQFSMMSVMAGGPDLTQAPFALEWCQDMLEAILSHPLIKAAMAGVAEDSEGAGADPGSSSNEDGSGGTSDSSLADGSTKNATAAPVFELQLPEAASDPGPLPGESEPGAVATGLPSDMEYYGGTDDEE